MLQVRRIQAPDAKAARQQLRALGADAVMLSIRGLDPVETPRSPSQQNVEIVVGVPTPASGRMAALSAYARSAITHSPPRAAKGKGEGAEAGGSQADTSADAVLSFSELLHAHTLAGGDVYPAGAEITRAIDDRQSGVAASLAGGAAATAMPTSVPKPLESARARGPEAAFHAAEEAFDTLRAIGLSYGVAEAALEAAIRSVPASALRWSDRLIDYSIGEIIRRFPTEPILSLQGLRGRTLGFAGATGVGKTTALLKAAVYLKRQGADIAVIGADGTRPGAREQLIAGCMVLGLPLTFTDTPDDLARSASGESNATVTLVDLPAGLGADASERPSAMISAFRAALSEPSLILTVPATIGERELRHLQRIVPVLDATAVTVTKLDEVPVRRSRDVPGGSEAFNVVASLGLPPLLCGTGRDLHADIRVLTATDLAIVALEAVQTPSAKPLPRSR